MNNPSRRQVATRILTERFALLQIGLVSFVVPVALACDILAGRPWRTEGEPSCLLAGLLVVAGIAATVLTRNMRREARVHASFFPEGTGTLALWHCMEKERVARPTIRWRDEWSSFVGFLYNGLTGKGWMLPRADGGRSNDPEAFLMAVAGAVKEARRRSGKTQEEVAWKSGVSVRTLKRIEATGKGKLSNLNAVCGALETRLPEAPLDGPPPPFRPWVHMVFGIALLASWVPASMPLWWTLLAVTRRQKIVAVACLGAMVSAACLGVRIYVSIHLRASPGDDPFVVASLASSASSMVSIFDAMALSVLAMGVAGLLGGAAWRSRGPQESTLLGAACGAMILVSFMPLERLSHRFHDHGLEIAGDMQTFAAVLETVRKHAELGRDPGWDQATQAMPWIYRAMGAPVPAWTRDPVAYRVHAAKMAEMRQLHGTTTVDTPAVH